MIFVEDINYSERSHVSGEIYLSIYMKTKFNTFGFYKNKTDKHEVFSIIYWNRNDFTGLRTAEKG
jgi:hypothetical protein